MAAPKRTPIRTQMQTRQPSEPSSKSLEQVTKKAASHMREAIRHLRNVGRNYASAVRLIDREARRARRQGHDVEAAILDRIATLMGTPATTVDGWAHDMDLAGRLILWLPLTDEIKHMKPKERKAWGVVFILNQRFDPSTQEQLVGQFSQKPGSPRTTGNFAIRAMELSREGKGWNEIARSLPCDWTMVEDPGNSIRREVQLLRSTLRDCGVSLESL